MLRKSMACSAVCIVTTFLHADDARGQKQIDVQAVDVQRTILKVTPTGVVTIRTATGDYFADTANQGISLGPAQVEIRGMQPPKYLKKGMIVRFEAELDLRMHIKSKVSALKILSLKQQRTRPVQPARPVQPGFPPPRFGGPRIPEPQPAKNPLIQQGFTRLDPLPLEGDEVNARGKSDIPKLARYAVVGEVAYAVRGDTFSISVKDRRPPKTLKVELAEDANIELFLTDIRFAEPGDKISAQGDMRIGPNVRRFWATQITITRGGPDDNVAAKPLRLGERRKFGDVGKRENPEDKAGAEFEGIILKIN